MDMNRRKFLGAAAVSPLAAKDIAKRAIEEAEFSASGIDVYGDTMYSGIHVPDPSPPMRSLWDAIKQMGVPEWKQDDMRDDARRSRTLDPDIASMKSVSLTGKMRTQWKRNYDVLLENAIKQTEMEKMKKVFFESNPDILEY